MLSPADLQREAEATGFRAEALEKALRLLELLEGFRSHPFLKSRVALPCTPLVVRREVQIPASGVAEFSPQS